ncbi:MAG TPA: LON peptidase substrate-binding domain-containing protein [Thermoanaerobaculia bacterium]|jgi:hypothetical protein
MTDPRTAHLPATIHLLPLGQLLLLPETAFPLTLTDARSRRTLDAALAADGYVGIIQELEGAGAASRFYSVGCLGRVHDLGADGEGRRVLLEGMIRFRVREELPPHPRDGGLPRAAVSYEEFARDLSTPSELEELAGMDLGVFKEKLVEFGRERFGTAGVLETLPPLQVVLFMAQTAPFTPAEKQALLEAPGLRELIGRLTRLLSLNFLTTTPDTSPPSRVN